MVLLAVLWPRVMIPVVAVPPMVVVPATAAVFRLRLLLATVPRLIVPVAAAWIEIAEAPVPA